MRFPVIVEGQALFWQSALINASFVHFVGVSLSKPSSKKLRGK